METIIIGKLSYQELELAKKMINEGFTKACLSMSQILQNSVNIKGMDLAIEEINDDLMCTEKTGKNVHVLKTELKGDLEGISHLVFSESDVSTLHNICLPPAMLLEDNLKTKKMKWAILVEAANLVASAVLNQLGNYLNLMVMPNVPSLKVMNGEKVNEHIQGESLTHDYPIKLKATFYCPNLDVSLDLIWLLEKNFIDNVKTTAGKSTVNLHQVPSKRVAQYA
ncbi:MAG: hypothetical protein OEX22_08050 [Cyclobacteriaceae bacterium]|nr:hypothetical protein [Cyclobacteriaceae bacterium]